MAVCYKPLWKLLIDKGLTKTQLAEMANIGSATLANMGKNKSVSIPTIEKICSVLDCEFADIAEIKKD